MNEQTEIVRKGKSVADEKEAIQSALGAALEPLASAKLALIDIDKSTITEMMETEAPAESVEAVGECFVLLRGGRDVTWRAARSLMTEESFFKSLMEMNCDLITAKQLLHCKNHLKVKRTRETIVTEIDSLANEQTLDGIRRPRSHVNR